MTNPDQKEDRITTVFVAAMIVAGCIAMFWAYKASAFPHPSNPVQIARVK